MVVKADRGQNRTNIFWDTAPEQFEAECMMGSFIFYGGILAFGFRYLPLLESWHGITILMDWHCLVPNRVINTVSPSFNCWLHFYTMCLV